MNPPLDLTYAQNQQLADASHSMDKWRAEGLALAKESHKKQFAVGDWLLDGEKLLGFIPYSDAKVIFHYDKATLKDFAYVSRNVPSSVRTDALPWQHHKLVARLAPEVQKKLLDFAVNVNSMRNCNMTVLCFRKEVNQKYPPTKKPKAALDDAALYRKLHSFVMHLYGSLPPAQREAVIRQHAQQLGEDFCSPVESPTQPEAAPAEAAA